MQNLLSLIDNLQFELFWSLLNDKINAEKKPCEKTFNWLKQFDAALRQKNNLDYGEMLAALMIDYALKLYKIGLFDYSKVIETKTDYIECLNYTGVPELLEKANSMLIEIIDDCQKRKLYDNLAISFNQIGYTLQIKEHYQKSASYLAKGLFICEKYAIKDIEITVCLLNNMIINYTFLQLYNKCIELYPYIYEQLARNPELEKQRIAYIYNQEANTYERLFKRNGSRFLANFSTYRLEQAIKLLRQNNDLLALPYVLRSYATNMLYFKRNDKALKYINESYDLLIAEEKTREIILLEVGYVIIRVYEALGNIAKAFKQANHILKICYNYKDENSDLSELALASPSTAYAKFLFLFCQIKLAQKSTKTAQFFKLTQQVFEHLIKNAPYNLLPLCIDYYKQFQDSYGLYLLNTNKADDWVYKQLSKGKSLYFRNKMFSSNTAIDNPEKKRLNQQLISINNKIESIGNPLDKQSIILENTRANIKLELEVFTSQNTLKQVLTNVDLALVKSLLADNDLIIDFYCSENNLWIVEISKNAPLAIHKIKVSKLKLFEDIKDCLLGLMAVDFTDDAFKLQCQKINKLIYESINLNAKAAYNLHIIIDGEMAMLPFDLVHNYSYQLQSRASKVQLYTSIFSLIKNFKHKQKQLSYKSATILLPTYKQLSQQNVVYRRGQALLPFSIKEAHMVLNELLALGLDVKMLETKDYGKTEILQRFEKSDIILITGHTRLSTYKGEEVMSIALSSNDDSYQNLYVSEIELLDLSRTKLVLLNCCETGYGKLVMGEGWKALNTAFCVAGAKNIVYTLIKVTDRAAQVFSETFFNFLLAGNKPATAMLMTKHSMKENGFFVNDYGPFQLMVS